MTILRIIDRLNVGGPAIHAVLTAQGLDRRRFRTVLVFGSVEPGEADMGYLLDKYEVEHVSIASLGRELRPLRDLKTAWQLYRVIRQVRPAIVHTHKAKAGALGRVCAALAGIPLRIHTYHGHVFHGYFGRWKTRAFIAIEQALAHLSSRLIALSPGLVAELADRYHVASVDRFTVVPLGFDLDLFANADTHRGELRKRLGLSQSVKLVAIVGRMVPVKDHATFINAAALVAERQSDVEFVFVGGGELEQNIRAEITRRGLDGRTHMLGWSRDLERIYPDVDVLALSSINEGTPVALIEAMASGVPVVATKVGGVPDLLRDGERGELVPPRNPVALADAIERSLTERARERAAQIRPAILREFGYRRLCDDLEQLYSELMSGGA